MTGTSRSRSRGWRGATALAFVAGLGVLVAGCMGGGSSNSGGSQPAGSSSSAPSFTQLANWSTTIPAEYQQVQKDGAVGKTCAVTVHAYYESTIKPLLHQAVKDGLEAEHPALTAGLTGGEKAAEQVATSHLSSALASLQGLQVPTCAKPLVAYYHVAIAWYVKGANALHSQGLGGKATAKTDFHNGDQTTLRLTLAYLKKLATAYHLPTSGLSSP